MDHGGRGLGVRVTLMAGILPPAAGRLDPADRCPRVWIAGQWGAETHTRCTPGAEYELGQFFDLARDLFCIVGFDGDDKRGDTQGPQTVSP